MTDAKKIEKAFEIVKGKIEKLDLLINNAGIIGKEFKESILNLTSSDLTNTYNVNVCGVLNVTNIFFPLLKGAKDCKPLVLNISTDMSIITSAKDKGHVAYRLSKCALNMLTKNYSIELGNQCMFVSIHPGWLDTEMGNCGDHKSPHSVENGVKSIIKQIYQIDQEKNGKLIDFNGNVMNW